MDKKLKSPAKVDTLGAPLRCPGLLSSFLGTSLLTSHVLTSRGQDLHYFPGYCLPLGWLGFASLTLSWKSAAPTPGSPS